MSATIKSNLNGSSNGCNLAALKKHINACLHRWGQKYIIKNQQHAEEITIPKEKCNCRFQEHLNRNLCKNCTFVQRVAACGKSLNTKVVQYLHTTQNINKDNSAIFKISEGPRHYGRKVEIVAKLLSTALIGQTAVAAASEAGNELNISHSSASARDYNKKDMTITDVNFFELREEYPDLNSEVRGILTARAQEGATISQIRGKKYILIT